MPLHIKNRFNHIGKNLRLLDPPPKPPGMDDDALRSLGLFEFVHLRFPSPVASHRDDLLRFISSFTYDFINSCNIRGINIPVDDFQFQSALGLPQEPLPGPPPRVAPQVLASTATKFIEAYILPVYERRRKRPEVLSSLINQAMRDVANDLAHRVDWLALIWEVARKEITDLVLPYEKNIKWDCFYSAYWLRVIWVECRNRFPPDVVLEPSVCAAAASLQMERDKDVVVTGPEPGSPRVSSRQIMSSCSPACLSDEGRTTGHIDSRDVEDGDGGDVPEVSADDVLLGGSRTRSAASPQTVQSAEDMLNSDSKCKGCATETAAMNSRVSMSPISKKHAIVAVSDTTYAQEEAQTEHFAENNEPSFYENLHPEDMMMSPSNPLSGSENCDMCDEHNELNGIRESVERMEQVNCYTVNISTIAPTNQKRKIVDGSCGEVITKKRGLITSFKHMEVQKDFNNGVLGILPTDEAIICPRTPRTYPEDWDATMSMVKHISEIKQSVEEVVQQYVENAATVFDSSTLPPSPKKLDQTPGAPLQLPDSACSHVKYTFQKVVADLKNLQTLANAEQFNQQAFIEEITLTLDAWENFFSSHFTEEINQMVTKLKVLKNELEDNSGQQHKSIMAELSERMKKVGAILKKAVLVREKITKSGMEIEQMKLAGNKSQESLKMQ